MEERLANLERAFTADSAQLIALHAVVRALIATHPDRKAAKAVFRSISTNYLQHMKDVGFEEGHPPDVPQAFAEPLAAAVQDWMQHFDR